MIDSKTWRAAFTLVFVAAATVAALRQLRPPDALPRTAPAAEFSGERALDHVRAFAREPHPFGSPAQEPVRQYIAAQLAALGVHAEIVPTPISRDARGGYPLATGIMRNVVARIPGTDNTRALVLMGHYDSVPGGPGAADDGEGVAVLLETMRALHTGPPLRNDLVLLFTDGEEAGLLGATAYAEQHARDTGLALEFESRGTSGPGIMFSTSAGNGWMVRHLAAAAPYPIANSLSNEIYRLLPNDTDLTVFKQAGIPCMDFAFIGDITNYHTRLDDAAHLDPRTLQHQGSYALSLARHFGNLDLRHAAADDVTYFNVPFLGMAVYPLSWGLPLAVLAGVLFAGIVAWGLLRRRISAGGIVVGLLAFGVLVAAARSAVFLLWKLVLVWHPGFRQMLQGDPYHAGIYRVASTALGIAAFAALYHIVRRRISLANLWTGALLLWLALAVVSAIYLPGAAYVFFWPLLFALAGLAFLLSRGGDPAESWSAVFVLWLCLLPGLLLIAPLVDQLFVAMTMALASAPALVLGLLLGLIIPLIELTSAPRRWWLPAGAAVVCIVFLLAGSARAGFDRQYPKPDSLFYGLDADTGAATWISGDVHPDPWTLPALGDHPQRASSTPFLPYLKWPLWVNPGRAVPLDAPTIERVEDHTDGGVRTLLLHITSRRGALNLTVYGDGHTKVLAAAVNGRSVAPSLREPDSKPGLALLDAIRFNQWSFEYPGSPAGGFDLRLKVQAGGAPLKLVAIDESYSLAALPGAPVRPADTMPLPWMPDSVMVRKSYTF